MEKDVPQPSHEIDINQIKELIAKATSEDIEIPIYTCILYTNKSKRRCNVLLRTLNNRSYVNEQNRIFYHDRKGRQCNVSILSTSEDVIIFDNFWFARAFTGALKETGTEANWDVYWDVW